MDGRGRPCEAAARPAPRPDAPRGGLSPTRAAVKAVWFNQPWFADRLQPGNADAPAGRSTPRLPRLRARVPAARGEASCRRAFTRPAWSRFIPRPRELRPQRHSGMGLAGDRRGPATRSSRCRPQLRRRRGLAARRSIVRPVHFPVDGRPGGRGSPREARLRGALPLPGGARSRRGRRVSGAKTGIELPAPEADVAAWLESLPFELTEDQRRPSASSIRTWTVRSRCSAC